jgi:hypothetical protein
VAPSFLESNFDLRLYVSGDGESLPFTILADYLSPKPKLGASADCLIVEGKR